MSTDKGQPAADFKDIKHYGNSLSPLSPLCITEGTHEIVRPKPRRPNTRIDGQYTSTPVQPQTIDLNCSPALRPFSNKDNRPRLSLPPEPRVTPTHCDLSRSFEDLNSQRSEKSPVFKERDRKPAVVARKGLNLSPGLQLVPEREIKVQQPPKENNEFQYGFDGETVRIGSKQPVTPNRPVNVRRPTVPRHSPDARQEKPATKSLKNVSKVAARHRLPHRHVSVDELRLLQFRRAFPTNDAAHSSSSDETRSSGHASMSDTLSSSPGGAAAGGGGGGPLLHSVPEEERLGGAGGGGNWAARGRGGKVSVGRSRHHRATPAKLVPAGSGLEDIKLAIQKLTLKSGGYSTSTYSSQSGSESSEPVVRRLMRHSSLETINTNVTAADEFLWVDSHNRLVELQNLPWSNHCVYRVLASGRCKHICQRVSMETIPRLSYLLQRALVRVAREAQRLARNVGLCSKWEVASALSIVLGGELGDSCVKACLRSAAMYAVSGDQLRQSKSSRAGLQLSVGRFHRWMADVRIGKHIHEYASVYLTAGIENLLEEIVFQCMPSDSEAMLTATLLEHTIAGNGDLWGLLQPYAHLNAGRIASGALAMDVSNSLSSESSHSPSTSKSVQQSLATTCVGSVSQLKGLLAKMGRLPTLRNGSQPILNHAAINSLFYFMRCSQLEHGQVQVQELTYERSYVVLPPLVEWLRVAAAHADHRHSNLIDADDIMQAARLLLPGIDCPVRSLGIEENAYDLDSARKIKLDAAFKLLSSGRPELISHAMTLLPSAKINTVNDAGFSPLMLACIQGDLNVVKCLLDAGADPNVETPCLPHIETQYWTPLCYAVLQGNVSLARLLLDRSAHIEGGLRPSEEDRRTLTPLQLASSTGNSDMVSLLLSYGANACLATLNKDAFSSYSGAAQRGSACAIAVAAAHGQRAIVHKLLAHPMGGGNREVLSLEEMLAEERGGVGHRMQVKALQEAMYQSCENGHVELTLDLRQLGVAWSLHCWMTSLSTATDLRLDSVVDTLLQDFVPSWPDDCSSQFIDECLPLLFNIFRYTKNEGTTLLLADIFCTCYGWEGVSSGGSSEPAISATPTAARIDPKFVNNPELSDVQFRVEGRVLYAHKIVLVTSSERFRNMLSSKLCEGSPPVVQINDIRYSIFELVMQYLYGGGTDKLEVADVDVLELMAAANFFQLEGLLKYTEGRAAKLVDLDNIVSMYIHAKVYNANQLLEHCQGFLLQNMVALLTYDDSVKRLLFGKKIQSHDVLAGLMGTLQNRLKQRIARNVKSN